MLLLLLLLCILDDHQGDIHFEVALQFLLMVISPILISVYLAYNVWALMKPILLANRTLRVIPTKGPFQIPFSTVETISPLVAPNAVVDCIL